VLTVALRGYDGRVGHGVLLVGGGEGQDRGGVDLVLCGGDPMARADGVWEADRVHGVQ